LASGKILGFLRQNNQIARCMWLCTSAILVPKAVESC